jgi:hypothetical protein
MRASLRNILSTVRQSWFALTPDEQKAAILVLALFVLGLIARTWHLMK